MSDIRCKNCGGDLDFEKTTGIGTCQYCETKQAIPQETGGNFQQTVNNISAPNQKRYAPTDKRSKGVMTFIKVALILIAAYIVIAIIVGVVMTLKYSG